MDDASGRVAAGQIALRAQKAHDEECVVVATREAHALFREQFGGSPLLQQGGAGL
jgi:hypothetical protein